MKNRPKVGVGVFIIKDKKILLGKRIDGNGKGTWGLTGGHLEFGESFEECAIRETKEEANLEISNLEIVHTTNDIFKGKHYVTIFLKSKSIKGELKNLEKNKIEDWNWFSWDNLPIPLFEPLQNLVDQGKNPLE